MFRSSLKAVPLFVLCTVILLMIVAPLQAAVRNDVVFRVGCEGFTSRGGDLILNRNNTGIGREEFVIYAVDGSGHVIYAHKTDSSFVGSTINFPPGLFFGWTSAPTANPLTVRLISSAGNGFNQQTVYTVTGYCGDLATISVDFMELEYVDGQTSPSVAINADPPRPGGTHLTLERGSGHPGYLIVNTGSFNIRSGDDARYTIVGRVPAGTHLRVLGRNLDRSWWYVQVGEIFGWVRSELTIIRGDLTHIPLMPVTGAITRPTFFVFSTQTLYTVPIPGALGMCQIPGNLEYYVIGRDLGTDWYELEVDCNGALVTGWLQAEKGAIRNPAGVFIPVTD